VTPVAPALTVQYRGTCGVCFEPHMLTEALTVRHHGWSQPGKHTKPVPREAWEKGSCFGSCRRPYELSASAPRAYLHEVLFPVAVQLDAYIEQLRGQPPLRFSGRTPVPGRPGYVGEHRTGAFEVCLRPGDPHGKGIPSYSAHLGKLIEEAVRRHERVMAEGLRFVERVERWSLAPVVPVGAKHATAHRENPKRPGFAVCGKDLLPRRGPRPKYAAALSEVTCLRCLPTR